jgi:hypothetical protein
MVGAYRRCWCFLPTTLHWRKCFNGQQQLQLNGISMPIEQLVPAVAGPSAVVGVFTNNIVKINYPSIKTSYAAFSSL